ncbi:MAG: hypothetical protein WCL32_04875 [Planctomycetota bacterium]
MFGSRGRMSFVWMGWLVVTMAGCKSLFAPHGIPDEPLILSRQPIESKGQVTASRPITFREPVPPPNTTLAKTKS